MRASESSAGDELERLKLNLSRSLTGTARLWRNLLLAWAQMLPGIKQTDLAERMGIASPTLVRILDHLEEQKLIQRRESAGDRRIRKSTRPSRRGR